MTAPFSVHDLPARQRLFSQLQWALLGGLLPTVLIGAPWLALGLPPEHPWHLSAWGLTLAGKILCYATAAVALNLIWGWCGILSLGHGLFFALGGYVSGMHLTRVAAGPELPDFARALGWTELPWFWGASHSFAATLLLVVLVPGAVAFLFGWLTFRSRIRGVYLSIITQALTWCAMLLFFRNETGLGGNTGFTGFRTLLGFDVTAAGPRLTLFLMSFGLLLAALVACRAIMASRFGRVVIGLRDAEPRLMASGYHPLAYQLTLWTFSAVLCGLAGALYVPQVGIINPSELAPVQSIEMAVWVAVGGRATVFGPAIGAVLVNCGKTWLTTSAPELWLFLLGMLFVLVTLILPDGVAGLGRRITARLLQWHTRARRHT